MRKLLRIAVTAFALLAPLALTGCAEEHDRADIEAYLRDTWGLRDAAVSAAPTEVTDADGYTDYLWTVTLGRQQFHVLDDYSWGMESMSNALWDDYSDVMLAARWPDGCAPFALETDASGPLFDARLVANFATRAELEALLDAETALLAQLEADGCNYDVHIALRHQNPLRARTVYPVDDADFDRVFYIDPDTGRYIAVDREAALRRFLLVCLDYRFTEPLADFSAFEVTAALRLQTDFCALAIDRDGQGPGAPELYLDLGASVFSYGVSFGTLYEVLAREGLPVEGDAWHYSFRGADGCVYEVSYDFCDAVFENGETGYYYRKDGVQTLMPYYFYNHFSLGQILAMTGLTLKTGSWQALEPRVQV